MTLDSICLGVGMITGERGDQLHRPDGIFDNHGLDQRAFVRAGGGASRLVSAAIEAISLALADSSISVSPTFSCARGQRGQRGAEAGGTRLTQEIDHPVASSAGDAGVDRANARGVPGHLGGVGIGPIRRVFHGNVGGVDRDIGEQPRRGCRWPACRCGPRSPRCECRGRRRGPGRGPLCPHTPPRRPSSAGLGRLWRRSCAPTGSSRCGSGAARWTACRRGSGNPVPVRPAGR